LDDDKLLIKNFIFMKNLENYGVVKMSFKETKSTGGGFWPLVRRIILAVAAAHEASGCKGHSGTYINQGGVYVASYDMH